MNLKGYIFACLAILLGLSSAQDVVEKRDLVSEIWDDIEHAVTCTACETILLLLKGAAALGDTVFVDTLTAVCKVSGAEDPDVCEGLIASEGPVIAHDLRQMYIPSHTAKLLCVTLLGLCPYPDVTPYAVPFPSPKPKSMGRLQPSNRRPIQIVQYSDIHVDPFYVPGSNTNCTKPICCRDYTATDGPENNSSPAGPYGDHKCDTPVSLEESMYSAIRQFAPNASFTVFTGDITDHAVWNTTIAQNTLDIKDAYARMGKLGPIYATVGNHESSPVSIFSSKGAGNLGQFVYDLISPIWEPWIGATAAKTAGDYGAYSTRVGSTNLRIISINTNFYYIANFAMYETTMETDPNGQLAWLVNELQSAETAGERVYIIGHTPLGAGDAFHDASNYFDQIINRYSDTIAALFFGHTHVDHFEIGYSDYANRTFANALAMSYIMPSLTPTAGHPAFRVYDVDPVTFAVLESTTYIADMSDPSFQAEPVWTKYYSAREAYGPLVNPALPAGAELSPAFWHNVTEALESSQSNFDAYFARKSRGWHVAACTSDCRSGEICQLRAMRAQDNCIPASVGKSLAKKKRDTGVAGHHDECGISVMRSMLIGAMEDKALLKELVGKLEDVIH